MIGPETFYIFAAYGALAAAGVGLHRAGLEASAAAGVGLVLTGTHVLVRSLDCPFDGANALAATFIGVFFLTVYVARDILHGRPTDSTS